MARLSGNHLGKMLKTTLTAAGTLALLAGLAAQPRGGGSGSGGRNAADAPKPTDPRPAITDSPDAKEANKPPATGGGLRTIDGVPIPKEMDVPLIDVPPSPALPAEEALKSFKLAPGFRIELVAAEPLVEDPVVIKFDGNGRLWVCEMRSYMPHLDPGIEEEKAIGRICFLEDTNGDGRMDKKTIFLDHLVLPRAVSPYRDGVLIAAPPYVWFARDTNGDGKCDEQQVLAIDYTNGANPEHQPNGLMPGLDNWIHNSQWGGRFRYVGDTPPAARPAGVTPKPPSGKGKVDANDPKNKLDPRWVRQNDPGRGQWGISQDDEGRIYINGNSDLLRGDYLPAHLLGRNPNYQTSAGINQKVADDQTVQPVRATPGINRGYQPQMLDKQGRLTTVTAACGPHIYRGDLLGKDPEGRDVAGNAFICEPSGNLVKRTILRSDDGVAVKAAHAYKDAEFLASTDERFRPVWVTDGPDGALYVADLYRGVLQHQRYVTPYLRREIHRRDLEDPIHLGRIYRIVPDNGLDRAKNPAAPKPNLLKAPAAELVQYLSHPAGWWRDMAQQQIVARNDDGVVRAVRKVATAGQSPLGRLHALYTLEGLEQLDEATVTAALADADPRVRVAALRLAEPFVDENKDLKSGVIPAILKLQKDERPEVRLAFLFTASTVATPEARAAVGDVYLRDFERPFVRDAVLTGVRGRELELAQSLTGDPDWAEGSPAKSALLNGLAACVTREGKPDRVKKLLDLAEAQTGPGGWRQSALAAGVATVAAPDKGGKAPKAIKLDAEPALLSKLTKSTDVAACRQGQAVAKLFTWPGKVEEKAAAVVPLTKDQQASFERGRVLFTSICAACHQAEGQGEAGKAPSMHGSELLLGSPERPIRVVLHGLRGKVTINGEVADMEMPTLAVLNDEQIADTLTFVRRSWGHADTPVSPADVAKVRDATKERGQPWTRDELKALKLPGGGAGGGAKPSAGAEGPGAPAGRS